MKGVCDGLRVVDFSTWMAGPLATMVLADNGADVIKVEPPCGDPARDLPAFQTWNRGKRGVVLDLKTGEGRSGAEALIESADVVVTSMRPGAAERLGIGYERVHGLNPAAVYAAISGYGEQGRLRDRKGYDALVTAASGRMMMFEGVATRPGPAYPALPCASYSAAMLTLQGILAALHRRRSTGRGEKVNISLLGALMPFDLIMWIGWQLRGDDLASEGVSAPMLLQKLMGERKMIDKSQPQSGGYDPRQLHRPAVRVPRPNYLTAVTKDGVWLQFANTIDHLCVAQMTALDLLDLYGEERFAKLPAVSRRTMRMTSGRSSSSACARRPTPSGRRSSPDTKTLPSSASAIQWSRCITARSCITARRQKFPGSMARRRCSRARSSACPDTRPPLDSGRHALVSTAATASRVPSRRRQCLVPTGSLMRRR
jgi:crotonobetainyl-CoA:carnitine CoA-transferase CaiB-like acyl-CoA transferase